MTRLANDVITVDGAVMRPSLRACLRLARRFGDFATVLRHIAEGNVETIATVIEEGTDNTSALPDLIRQIGQNGLFRTLHETTGPVTAFVMQIVGADELPARTRRRRNSPRKAITFTESYEKLFAIGTGVLGWTPENTWSATPAEIIAAHKGRLELLQALFGSGEKDKVSDEDLTLGQKAKKLFLEAGAKIEAKTA